MAGDDRGQLGRFLIVVSNARRQGMTMIALEDYRSLRGRVWPHAFQPRPGDTALVQRIRARSDELKPRSDEQLVSLATELRARVVEGATVTSEPIVVDCFALATEAVRRTLGMTFYDVQLLAGLALASGAIAEMQTGEGKTIVAALPALLHALGGRGVHVATTNSYLAGRDCAQLRPAFELLGFSVGILEEKASPRAKREAYGCDVTYGPGYEFGFDYLRDQVALRKRPRLPLGAECRLALRGRELPETMTVQRVHAFAIVDEIDSVLIDEATTPLILSGALGDPATPTVYRQAQDTAADLAPDRDYLLNRETKELSLTETGAELSYARLGPLARSELKRPWSTYVQQALRAQLLLARDVDYVVVDDEVMIVDQNTGRICPERSWRDGLHQAVEIKEGVTITSDGGSLARITRQRCFQLYDNLSGMTGTATGNEAELATFYGLSVVEIPLHRPSRRARFPARYFVDQASKIDAIGSDTARRNALGQPVLIGTRTIALSEKIAARLREIGLPHRVLNGKQDEDEATLVAQAGQHSAVTIATNMAGRGTDIRPDDKALAAGGLHVVATEHNDSARIDRQLIGRAARQGQPGSYQFFVASDDPLIQELSPRLASRMQAMAGPDGECAADFAAAIGRLQQRAERQNFARRRRMVQQDHWLDTVLETLVKEA